MPALTPDQIYKIMRIVVAGFGHFFDIIILTRYFLTTKKFKAGELLLVNLFVSDFVMGIGYF